MLNTLFLSDIKEVGFERLILISIIAFFIALTTLYFLIRIFQVYQRNSRQVKNLDQYIKKLEEVEKSVKGLVKSDEMSLKGVGFTRFKPFGDAVNGLGYSLGVINKNGDGFVITVMSSRDGSRVFMREIDSGVPQSPISEEEENMLKETWNKLRDERR